MPEQFETEPVTSPPNTYDQTPYPEMCFAQSHPDRLATIATLLGLSPTPVQHCRVLELGCASGGNLIPMAYALPDSQFVGVDLSGQQIAAGQALVNELGLTNITLKPISITDLIEADGQFDYIIAHGVYSWVPSAVREALLAVCQRNLAPNGLAYISYNTYPGWHMLGMVRDMMRYHVREITEPLERANEARGLIKFLAESAADKQDYGAFMQSYAPLLQKQSAYLADKLDASLLHDELEEVNDPVYFYQFIEHAERYGLQYVAEAEFPMVMPTNLSEKVREHLFGIANSTIELEQYMDYVRNRTFRQTILCHAAATVNRQLSAAPVTTLFIGAQLHPVNKAPDVRGTTVEKFQSNDEAAFATNHPVSKAALLYLAEITPRTIAFNDLLEIARQRVYQSPEAETSAADRQMLAANLLQAFCYSMALVQLHSYLQERVLTISEHPVASAYARVQAKRSPLVSNLYHESTRLENVNRGLLLCLDGTRDRAMLIEIMVGWDADGMIGVQEHGEPITDPKRLRQMLGTELDHRLQWLARAGLLVG